MTDRPDEERAESVQGSQPAENADDPIRAAAPGSEDHAGPTEPAVPASGSAASGIEDDDEVKPRAERVAEIVTVFVLSITAVLTAWCGFEASKWGGEMSIAFSQASSARIQAAVADGTARDARQYDLTLYTQ